MNKFLRWLKFNPPSAATLEDWDKFKLKFEEEAPIRYFICEVVIRRLRSKIYSLKRNLKDGIARRIDPPNIIRLDNEGKTEYGLHDTILFASFGALKDYVEVNLAIDGVEHKHLRWKGFFYFLNYSYRIGTRSPDQGVKCLIDEIEMAKTWDEPRAAILEKALKLYLWWTITRRTRTIPPPPFELKNGRRKRAMHMTPEERQASRAYTNLINSLYEKWEDEDNQMLVQLVQIMKELR